MSVDQKNEAKNGERKSPGKSKALATIKKLSKRMNKTLQDLEVEVSSSKKHFRKKVANLNAAVVSIQYSKRVKFIPKIRGFLKNRVQLWRYIKEVKANTVFSQVFDYLEKLEKSEIENLSGYERAILSFRSALKKIIDETLALTLKNRFIELVKSCWFVKRKKFRYHDESMLLSLEYYYLLVENVHEINLKIHVKIVDTGFVQWAIKRLKRMKRFTIHWKFISSLLNIIGVLSRCSLSVRDYSVDRVTLVLNNLINNEISGSGKFKVKKNKRNFHDYIHSSIFSLMLCVVGDMVHMSPLPESGNHKKFYSLIFKLMSYVETKLEFGDMMQVLFGMIRVDKKTTGEYHNRLKLLQSSKAFEFVQKNFVVCSQALKFYKQCASVSEPKKLCDLAIKYGMLTHLRSFLVQERAYRTFSSNMDLVITTITNLVEKKDKVYIEKLNQANIFTLVLERMITQNYNFSGDAKFPRYLKVFSSLMEADTEYMEILADDDVYSFIYIFFCDRLLLSWESFSCKGKSLVLDNLRVFLFSGLNDEVTNVLKDSLVKYEELIDCLVVLFHKMHHDVGITDQETIYEMTNTLYEWFVVYFQRYPYLEPHVKCVQARKLQEYYRDTIDDYKLLTPEVKCFSEVKDWFYFKRKMFEHASTLKEMINVKTKIETKVESAEEEEGEEKSTVEIEELFTNEEKKDQETQALLSKTQSKRKAVRKVAEIGQSKYQIVEHGQDEVAKSISLMFLEEYSVRYNEIYRPNSFDDIEDEKFLKPDYFSSESFSGFQHYILFNNATTEIKCVEFSEEHSHQEIENFIGFISLSTDPGIDEHNNVQYEHCCDGSKEEEENLQTTIENIIIYGNVLDFPIVLRSITYPKNDRRLRFIGDVTMNDNTPHGWGLMIYRSGNFYFGNFKNGKFHGENCLFIWAKGDWYAGTFRRGIKHGEGRLTFRNGKKYVGQFRSNAIFGRGNATFSDDTTYSGQYLHGKRSGKGKHVNLSHNPLSCKKSRFRICETCVRIKMDPIKYYKKYSGEWKENVKDGHGTLFTYDGVRFQGEFKNDRMSGEIRIYSRKRKLLFHGNFVDGKPPEAIIKVHSLKKYFLDPRKRHSERKRARRKSIKETTKQISSGRSNKQVTPQEERTKRLSKEELLKTLQVSKEKKRQRMSKMRETEKRQRRRRLRKKKKLAIENVVPTIQCLSGFCVDEKLKFSQKDDHLILTCTSKHPCVIKIHLKCWKNVKRNHIQNDGYITCPTPDCGRFLYSSFDTRENKINYLRVPEREKLKSKKKKRKRRKKKKRKRHGRKEVFLQRKKNLISVSTFDLLPEEESLQVDSEKIEKTEEPNLGDDERKVALGGDLYCFESDESDTPKFDFWKEFENGVKKESEFLESLLTVDQLRTKYTVLQRSKEQQMTTTQAQSVNEETIHDYLRENTEECYFGIVHSERLVRLFVNDDFFPHISILISFHSSEFKQGDLIMFGLAFQKFNSIMKVRAINAKKVTESFF